MNSDGRDWAEHFQIQSEVDLDFVIGQHVGLPVGMQRSSPPEFRRRVLASLVSYQLGLRSIDYASKRYVGGETYDEDEILLGDEISHYLRNSATCLEKELKNLHTSEGLTTGIFGAEITLYRIPFALDSARMLSNRGLLLEVLPILRLCVEMMSWAHVAFYMGDKEEVTALRAQSCISQLKESYKSAGKLYGYLSRFAHWGHVVHKHFLDFDEEHVGVLKASTRYRAMTLALCLIVLDVFVEVIRKIYGQRSDCLVLQIQGTVDQGETRRTYQHLSRIADMSGLSDLQEIKSLLE
jgi:hypothetical protein